MIDWSLERPQQPTTTRAIEMRVKVPAPFLISGPRRLPIESSPMLPMVLHGHSPAIFAQQLPMLFLMV